MKSIEFLAPVEAMRGNLSGNQKLLYPTQNNAAWDAPSDKRSYSTNYQPRYIGAKRARDGKKYFATKKRSAVMMSPKMRKNMAVLSCSSVLANIIMDDLTNFTELQNRWLNSYEHKQLNWTFKHWLLEPIKTALLSKNNIVYNAPGATSIVYDNPFRFTGGPIPGSSDVTTQYFPFDLLYKFFNQLAVEPNATFTVDGLPAIAFSNKELGAGDPNSIVWPTSYPSLRNPYVVLDWSALASGYLIMSTGEGEEDFVYVLNPDGSYIPYSATAGPVNGGKYLTTDVAPA